MTEQEMMSLKAELHQLAQDALALHALIDAAAIVGADVTKLRELLAKTVADAEAKAALLVGAGGGGE